jgi:antitoxin (DNA-binding transcriptional repressor) of toxin-antitoxin stability system
MEVSVLDLRKNMRGVIAAIDRNERVTLTYRGSRKAVIIPFDTANKPKVKVADHPAFGVWADRHDLDDVPAYLRELRKPRSL